MKKIFAILMVLALVAGFAFAAVDTERLQLKVESVVAEKLPAFQLRFEGKEIDRTDANNHVVTETVKNVATNDAVAGQGATFANSAADPKYEDAEVLYVGFDLGTSGDHTADFYAWLVKNSEGYYAKTKKPFTLTFSDGVFTGLKSKGADIEDSEPTISVTPGTLTSGGSISASGAKATITFDGTSCPESEVQVAKATYTWTGIPQLDMGSYQANIKLTVTQE